MYVVTLKGQCHKILSLISFSFRLSLSHIYLAHSYENSPEYSQLWEGNPHLKNLCQCANVRILTFKLILYRLTPFHQHLFGVSLLSSLLPNINNQHSACLSTTPPPICSMHMFTFFSWMFKEEIQHSRCVA
jgi:hypothetical protein